MRKSLHWGRSLVLLLNVTHSSVCNISAALARIYAKHIVCTRSTSFPKLNFPQKYRDNYDSKALSTTEKIRHNASRCSLALIMASTFPCSSAGCVWWADDDIPSFVDHHPHCCAVSISSTNTIAVIRSKREYRPCRISIYLHDVGVVGFSLRILSAHVCVVEYHNATRHTHTFSDSFSSHIQTATLLAGYVALLCSIGPAWPTHYKTEYV